MDSGIVIISAYIYVMLTLMCIINIQKFERINPIPLELQRRYMHGNDSDGVHSSDADDEGDIPNI
jgi:uncharacterized membrane protein YjgN (DUF898 family)